MANPPNLERVAVYIDGYSLYHGLVDGGCGDCLWLDMRALALGLVSPSQTLISVKYFTSYKKGDPLKRQRQITYLEALEVHTGIVPVRGKQHWARHRCATCGAVTKKRNEKWTDVNIAIHVLDDALAGRFETAFLVTADSDYVPLVNRIRQIPG